MLSMVTLILNLHAYRDKGRQFKVSLCDLARELLQQLQLHRVPVLCLDNSGNVKAVLYIDRIDFSNRRIYMTVPADCDKLIVKLTPTTV